jgi:hypothetical protein
VTALSLSPRHHIEQFSTPQKRYFASTLLAGPDRLFIVKWSRLMRAASYVPRHPAGVPPFPTTPTRGVGAWLVVTRKDEARMR